MICDSLVIPHCSGCKYVHLLQGIENRWINTSRDSFGVGRNADQDKYFRKMCNSNQLLFLLTCIWWHQYTSFSCCLVKQVPRIFKIRVNGLLVNRNKNSLSICVIDFRISVADGQGRVKGYCWACMGHFLGIFFPSQEGITYLAVLIIYLSVVNC